MTVKRTEKVAKQLQKDLGEILDRMRNAHFQGAMITVVDTEISPDLGFLKAFVSIYPIAGGKKEDVFALLGINTPEIRHQLAARVKNQLRKVPEIVFFIDESLDRAQRLEALFKELKSSHEDESES
jgi:ribosome-binding factor A